MQLLAGANPIDVDFGLKEDRALFSRNVSKLFRILVFPVATSGATCPV